MEQQLLALLDSTQSVDERPRKAAEAEIVNLYGNDNFPIALTRLASTQHLPLASRQSALTTLKRYVSYRWSDGYEDYNEMGTGPTSDAAKDVVRPELLRMVTDPQRKVRSIAAAVVSKIAISDFPEQWPNLLGELLGLIGTGDENHANGALHVLNDLLEEGLGEDQFIGNAKQIISILHGIATQSARSFSVRALSVATYRSCIETLGIMKSEKGSDVTEFAREVVEQWVQWMIEVMRSPYPEVTDEAFNGLVSLKIQVIRTLMQIRLSFQSISNTHIEPFFSATWADLDQLKDRYVQLFVASEAEGRLVDGDNLPYSLDLYMLELVDCIQSCLKNKVVCGHLEKAGFAGQNQSPLSQLIYAIVLLSQIAGEDRAMWDIDLNVFLSEETGLSANYTPRTACGDLILKIAEVFPEPTIQLLFDHTQRIFTSLNDDSVKEATLNVWDMLLTHFAEVGTEIDRGVTEHLLQHIVSAITSTGSPFLVSRGYSVAGCLAKAMYSAIISKIPEFIQQALHAANSHPSEVVQISAIRSFQKYTDVVPPANLRQFQGPMIISVRKFLEQKSDDDPEDSQDVLMELVETVRSALLFNREAILDPSIQAAELLFSIATNGVTNPHLCGVIRDAFQDIITSELRPLYVPLCHNLLPFLVHAMSLDQNNNEGPLMELATEVVELLAEEGTSPLPAGFVEAVMPNLTRILLTSLENDTVQSACAALKEIIKHDTPQFLSWRSSSGTSLESVLHIIDRLLKPEFSESAAMEVGGLAAEVVDRAGSELGQYFPQLLSAVAVRLTTAEIPPFTQSLLLVFARLVMKNAKDVVDFLSTLNIENRSGLEIVMKAWMSHSPIFSGYQEIRENVIALCQLFNLHDSRLELLLVEGDLIVPESNRIVTRSRAQTMPDQYTMVPVPLKILKILTAELAPSLGGGGGGGGGLSGVPGEAVEVDSEGEEWEDEVDPLSQFGLPREELLALGSSARGSRQADDETYGVLLEFFKNAARDNTGRFEQYASQMKEEERYAVQAVVQSQ